MVVEVKEVWQIPYSAVGVTRIRQTCAGVSQLVEEGVDHGINRRQSLSWCVLEQLRDQVDSVGVCFTEHLDACKYGEQSQNSKLYGPC